MTKNHKHKRSIEKYYFINRWRRKNDKILALSIIRLFLMLIIYLAVFNLSRFFERFINNK